MSGLTPDQLDFYRTEGYLLVEDVIDPSLSSTSSSPKLTPLSMPPPSRPMLPANCPTCTRTYPLPSAWSTSTPSWPSPSSLLGQVNGKLKTEGMFAILTQPALLDIVESVDRSRNTGPSAIQPARQIAQPRRHRGALAPRPRLFAARRRRDLHGQFLDSLGRCHP